MYLQQTTAVFIKDFQSELRTRYAINALVMFVITTLSIILFSIGGERVSPDVLAGMLWVVIFFSAMSGLSRSFVSEEERGTTMTLQLLARPAIVYFGKLLFNLVLILSINALVVTLYLLFIPLFIVQTASIFFITLILGSVGLACASTIIAAIIAKANSKGTLYPVLSFPILLPLLMTVMNATKLALDGAPITEATGEFRVLVSYSAVLVAVSWVLFDYVWKD
jgi:heme exporter protein B